MPSVINPLPTLRVCAFRPHPPIRPAARVAFAIKPPACRSLTEDKSTDLPKAPEGTAEPNMHQQEHVSEEAAKIAKVQGGEGPDIEGQGTPVQEILSDEKETRKQAPQVMKEQVKSGQAQPKPSTRPFSTFARSRIEAQHESGSPSSLDASMLPSAEQRAQYTVGATSSPLSSSSSSNLPTEETKGHKFPLPTLPLPRELVKDYRYDPIVTQITNLIMRDGKKATAQRFMAIILSILRTSPPPTYNPSRPLLPGAPPASHLSLNPVLYLTLAIDSVAPLIRLRSQKGAAGGGVALQIPVPLGLKQRRRQAFMWILDAASKNRGRGSGNYRFPKKVADEIISIVEGRSGLWDRRNAVHKLGTVARTNISYRKIGAKRR